MKNLLVSAIVAAASLLPFHNAEAQGMSFGGFEPNYKFTFTVQDVVSIKTQGALAPPTKAPIPRGLPKYKKGQKVKFKIGNKGQIIAKGMNIPFSADRPTANVYTRVTTGLKAKTDTCTIAKSSNNKATAATIAFLRYSGSPFNMTTYSLTYTLR